MKTSRLKNIVIVILLLVNAFLLFLLLSRRAEEHDSNERRVEQLCTLFALLRYGLYFLRSSLSGVFFLFLVVMYLDMPGTPLSFCSVHSRITWTRLPFPFFAIVQSMI